MGYVLVPREATEEMKRGVAPWLETAHYAPDSETAVSTLHKALISRAPPHLDDLLKAMEECCEALKEISGLTRTGATLMDAVFIADHALSRLSTAREKVKP